MGVATIYRLVRGGAKVDPKTQARREGLEFVEGKPAVRPKGEEETAGPGLLVFETECAVQAR